MLNLFEKDIRGGMCQLPTDMLKQTNIGRTMIKIKNHHS